MNHVRQNTRIAVLISGRGSNMQSIVNACQSGKIDAEIACILSNNPDAKGLKFAHESNLNTVILDHQDFSNRALFDTRLIEELNKFSPDLIILAGFERILTPEFVHSFAGKILNIHPSLLPKYPGRNTHERVLETNEKQHGASVHFLIEELDAGPVIIQSIVDIKADDTPDLLASRVRCTEHIIYPEAISWIVNNQIYTDGERCFYRGSVMIKPAKWYNGKLTKPIS